MVWHKFTWESDLKVVSNVIGKDRAGECENFDPGEAYMMTDWDDKIERVKFRRKETFDAGATPGLESVSTPDLKQVSDQLVSEIQGDQSATVSSRPGPGENGGTATTAGTADTLEDFTDSATAPDDADGEAVADSPDSETENEIDTTASGGVDAAELTDIETFDEDELEELDDDEIVAKAKRVTQENQILKDEVGELRDISDTDPDDGSSPFTDSPPNGYESSASPSRRYGRNRDESTERTESITPPKRPAPPGKQEVDNEASRALFEFGELMIYLWKVMVFSVRYVFYRIRVWLRRGRGKLSSSRQ